jgi:hypothetical protein
MWTKPLSLFAFAALLLPSPALAQATGPSICGARAQIVAQLEDRLGESVRSVGLVAPNRIVEVYASDETGTWTIAVTMANGRTCLMAAGQYFEAYAPELPGETL